MTISDTGAERAELPSGRYAYGQSKAELRPDVPGRRRLAQLESELAARGVVAAEEAPAAAPPVPAGHAAPSVAPSLPVARVHPHPGNVRADLGDLSEMAASIRAHGIIAPIAVEPHPRRPGHWQVIAGHRRLAAARLAGLAVVPVTIRAAGAAHPEELMLIENLHREDLNAMDKAEALGRLKNEKGYSVARISQSTGLAEPTIYTYLSLLDLAPKTRQAVREGRLSTTEAVEAVRRVRKRQRKAAGKADPGTEWEPDWFTSRHPLARKAKALCDGREHSMRRRIGKIACGECLETVIRADERTVAAALSGGEPWAPSVTWQAAELAGLRQRIRRMRRTRVAFAVVVVLQVLVSVAELSTGRRVPGLLMAFGALMFTVNLGLQTASLRRVTRYEARLAHECRPRPDYGLIAAREMEIWKRAFHHAGAPSLATWDEDGERCPRPVREAARDAEREPARAERCPGCQYMVTAVGHKIACGGEPS